MVTHGWFVCPTVSMVTTSHATGLEKTLFAHTSFAYLLFAHVSFTHVLFALVTAGIVLRASQSENLLHDNG